MPNEIKVTVAAKETGLSKVETEARAAGKKIGDSLDQGFKEGERAGSRAQKSIGDDLEQVERSGREAGKQVDVWISRGMDDAAKASNTAKGRITDDLEQIGAEAKKTGAKVEDAFGGGGGLGESLGEAIGGGFDLGGIVDGLASKAGPMGAAAAALGTIVATQMLSAVQTVWEEDAIGGVIAAQNDGTVAQAKQLGDIAGDAFFAGFGDSIEDVGGSLAAVLGNSLAGMDAPAEELQKLTELAVTASEVVGEEANSIARAAKQLLVNGLADNAEQAIDIIVSASQAGLNVSGDLIDTIVEYSTKWRDLGLSGPQAMGLISQAMQAGARDTDYAADALKEFSIRAIDGSESTARGFRTLGLDAGKMATEIGRGGKSANEALGLTLDKLRAIEDPVLRDQAAVDLFGTKAEDLGDALYAMDLDTVAEGMGNVEGATGRAAAVIAATTPPTERMSRAWDGFINGVAEGVMIIDAVMNQKTLEFLGPKFSETGDAVAGSGDAASGANEQWVQFVETLDEAISKSQELASGVLDLSGAHIGYQEAIDSVSDALEKNGENLDLSTEGGRENQGVLNDLADQTWTLIAAMEQQGATTTEIEAFMGSARAEFIRSATALGMDATAANKLADKLGLIPGDYKANVDANTSNAIRKLKELERYLAEVARSRTINVGAAGSGIFDPPKATGGATSAAVYGSGLPHAAEGGAQNATFWAHEQGPELIRQPNGSVVVPAGLSQMLMQGFAGGGGHTVIELRSAGSKLDDLLVEILRKAILNRGGNVQTVLGKAGVR